MSSMGKTVIKKIGAREVVCRELTVAAARLLLQGSAASDVLSDVLFEDVRLGDLLVFTNLTSDEVGEMLPSELIEVVAGCKEANPDFFAMLARLAKVQAEAQASSTA